MAVVYFDDGAVLRDRVRNAGGRSTAHKESRGRRRDEMNMLMVDGDEMEMGRWCLVPSSLGGWPGQLGPSLGSLVHSSLVAWYLPWWCGGCAECWGASWLAGCYVPCQLPSASCQVQGTEMSAQIGNVSGPKSLQSVRQSVWAALARPFLAGDPRRRQGSACRGRLEGNLDVQRALRARRAYQSTFVSPPHYGAGPFGYLQTARDQPCERILFWPICPFAHEPASPVPASSQQPAADCAGAEAGQQSADRR